MKEFRLETKLWLPRPRPQIFPFFADAYNLEAITPPWLKFRVLTPRPVLIQRGTLIDYRLQIHGIPVHWRTEITVWQPPFQFVDEQRRGPYKFWRHTHTFEECDGGTLCSDHLLYCPRGGALLNWLFVWRNIEEIFEYRRQRLMKIFAPVS